MSLSFPIHSTIQLAYDTLSRLVSETQGPNPISTHGKTISYDLSDTGNRDSVSYFSGYQLDYANDALGRRTLSKENTSGDDLVSWTYFGPGRRIENVSYLNGTTTKNTYDGLRRVTNISHKDSTPTEFAGFSYGYDDAGNPIYEARSHQGTEHGGDAYAYDKAYRLTAALIGSDDPAGEIVDGLWDDFPYDRKIDYNMDDDSSRASVVTTSYGQGASTESYTSNSLNQYTAIASVSRTHDDNGNLTDDGTHLYSFDYKNNLVKVEDAVGTIATYEFDALGRRKQKTTSAGTTVFFYDGEHVVEEYDNSDNLLRKFVYGQRIDEIRLMIAPDVADVDEDENTTEVLKFYYHTQLIGSVTHVTDYEEDVVEQYEYTPYGKTTIRDGGGSDLSGQSGIENPYMFTARRLEEETALYHYRRRAYSPRMGRFLQRDPAESAINSYAYASSAPSLNVDPLGLCDKPHDCCIVYFGKSEELGLHYWKVKTSGDWKLVVTKSESPPFSCCPSCSVDHQLEELDKQFQDEIVRPWKLMILALSSQRCSFRSKRRVYLARHRAPEGPSLSHPLPSLRLHPSQNPRRLPSQNPHRPRSGPTWESPGQLGTPMERERTRLINWTRSKRPKGGIPVQLRRPRSPSSD